MSVMSWDGTVNEAPVLTVRGDQELLARAGHLFDPHEEFVCAATDMSTWMLRARPANALEQMRARMTDSGVSVHKLYTPRAVQLDRPQLTELSELGVHVRIHPTGLAQEAIIIDRKVAILAGPPTTGVRTYSVVRAPAVVAAVRGLYQATWDSATNFTDIMANLTTPAIDAEGLAILRQLSAGRKDQAAARELGVSVRTYRRRVAELMVLLGADSRFQAGVRAQALGLGV